MIPRSTSYSAEEVLMHVQHLMQQGHGHIRIGPSEMPGVEMNAMPCSDGVPVGLVITVPCYQIRPDTYRHHGQAVLKEHGVQVVVEPIQPNSRVIELPVMDLDHVGPNIFRDLLSLHCCLLIHVSASAGNHSFGDFARMGQCEITHGPGFGLFVVKSKKKEVLYDHLGTFV